MLGIFKNFSMRFTTETQRAQRGHRERIQASVLPLLEGRIQALQQRVISLSNNRTGRDEIVNPRPRKTP
jgi:hypothetical protein